MGISEPEAEKENAFFFRLGDVVFIIFVGMFGDLYMRVHPYPYPMFYAYLTPYLEFAWYGSCYAFAPKSNGYHATPRDRRGYPYTHIYTSKQKIVNFAAKVL